MLKPWEMYDRGLEEFLRPGTGRTTERVNLSLLTLYAPSPRGPAEGFGGDAAGLCVNVAGLRGHAAGGRKQAVSPGGAPVDPLRPQSP